MKLAALVALLLPQLAAAGWVTLSATPPFEYEDGSPITGPLSYVWYGSCVRPGQYDFSQSTQIPTIFFDGLPDQGLCYFVVTAVDQANLQSRSSDEAIFDFGRELQIPSTPLAAPAITWTAAPPLAGARFVRLVITKRRGGDNSIQLADVQLLLGANLVTWPSSARATNPGGLNPALEGPANAIDATAATKFLDFNFQASPTAVNGSSTLLVDVGVAVTFDSYRWRTANDMPTRDPVSWRLETAAVASGPWTIRSTVTDAVVPSTRGTWTSTFGAL